jgi:hypothetical protein
MVYTLSRDIVYTFMLTDGFWNELLRAKPEADYSKNRPPL